jgi:hypothetical protein
MVLHYTPSIFKNIHTPWLLLFIIESLGFSACVCGSWCVLCAGVKPETAWLVGEDVYVDVQG